MEILGILSLFGIVFLIYWVNKPKSKTQEEIEEEKYNKGYRIRNESFKDYKERIAKEEKEEKIKIKRFQMLNKKFYEYETILLELDDFYFITKNKHICNENDLKPFKDYLLKIQSSMNKLKEKGYNEEEISISSYLQRCFLPYDFSKIGFEIETTLGTIHHPNSLKFLFTSYHNYIDGDNDYSKSSYLFTSPDYSKYRNEKGLELKQKLWDYLNPIEDIFSEKSL